MKYILLSILLLFPAMSNAQPATFAEIQTMLEGVDLEGLNTFPVIVCVRNGEPKTAGAQGREDPRWMLGTTKTRERLVYEAGVLNRTSPDYVWRPKCRPDYLSFAPVIIEIIGSLQEAQTARWYPPVTVVIDGENVPVTDYDERRYFATCQPYKPDGFTRRSFIKAGCRD